MQIPMTKPRNGADRAAAGGLMPRPAEAELAMLLEHRRTRLWEIPSLFHCSIIGTCLTPGELRKLVRKVVGYDVDLLSEITLHNEGVRLAGNQGFAGKLLQKTLDRRHQLTLKQFAKAKDATELGRLWDEAKRSGEIPGAYWAVLTHPLATEALIDAVFSDVHMLSHLVGAANRADIRRLNALEAENAALHARAQQIEDKLQTTLRARDATIRQLNDMLAHRLVEEQGGLEPDTAGSAGTPADEIAALRQAVAQLRRRLSTETGRRERAEQKAAEGGADLAQATTRLDEATKREQCLAEELAAAERQLALDPRTKPAAPAAEIAGATLLYVGGRPGLILNLQNAAARAEVRLLHHDGGIDDKRGLLAGMVGRAEAVLFPVDCVSHDAVATLKRLCRQAGKPYLPLRSASMASFFVGLDRLRSLGSPDASEY